MRKANNYTRESRMWIKFLNFSKTVKIVIRNNKVNSFTRDGPTDAVKDVCRTCRVRYRLWTLTHCLTWITIGVRDRPQQIV